MKMYENDWLFINNLLLKMYSSHNDSIINSNIMENLAYLIPYSSASFFLRDHTGNRLLKDPEGTGFRDRVLENFSAHSIESVPHRWVNFYAKSLVIRDTDIFPEDVRYEIPYYQSLLENENIKYGLTLSLCHEGINVGVLTLFRDVDSEDFTERQMYIAEQLVGHIACFAYNIYSSKFDLLPACKDSKIEDVSRKYCLSSRESEVLEIVCRGKSAREISGELFIAETTVKKHLANIYGKMEIKNKSELIKIINSIM